MTTKQEILDYLDNVLHPIVSPDNWNVYSELHDMIEELQSAEPVKHEECEYVITKGKAGYREEYKCSACGDSFYWTQDRARRMNRKKKPLPPEKLLEILMQIYPKELAIELFEKLLKESKDK